MIHAQHVASHPNLTSPIAHSLLVDRADVDAHGVTVTAGDVLMLRVAGEPVEAHVRAVNRWSVPMCIAIEPIENVVGESVTVVGIKKKQIEPYRAPHRRNA